MNGSEEKQLMRAVDDAGAGFRDGRSAEDADASALHAAKPSRDSRSSKGADGGRAEAGHRIIVARRVTLSLVFVAVVASLAFDCGLGTPSTFGVGQFFLLCPLGGLEAMIADRSFIPVAAISMAVVCALRPRVVCMGLSCTGDQAFLQARPRSCEAFRKARARAGFPLSAKRRRLRRFGDFRRC